MTSSANSEAALMRRTKAELVDEVMALRGQIREHEESAEYAEERFPDAIATMSEGFAYFDPEDRLVLCNDQYKSLFPMLADLMIPGVTFTKLLNAAIERGQVTGSPGEVAKWKKSRMTEHVNPSVEGIIQHLNNGRWIQTKERRTKAGGFIGIRTDVTELKEAQEQLANQKAVLQATLENLDQGVSMMDGDLKMVACKSSFRDLLDLPADKFPIRSSLEEAFRINAGRGEYGPGDVEEQIRERMDLARKFEPHVFERTRPDGTVIEVSGNPVEGGGFVTTYTDVTERKRAEEALRESEQRLFAILEDSPIGTSVTRKSDRNNFLSGLKVRDEGARTC